MYQQLKINEVKPHLKILKLLKYINVLKKYPS